MTVTKQQQLEWLANKATWGDDRTIAYMMSRDEVGFVVGLLTRLTGAELLAGHSHIITREEWQQSQPAQPAQDGSWHECGELPPVGCECEVFDGDDWVQSFIVGRSRSGDVVVQTRTGYFEASHAKFRPLRTEREKAIDEMLSVIPSVVNEKHHIQVFGLLYDAGYRKVNP